MRKGSNVTGLCYFCLSSLSVRSSCGSRICLCPPLIGTTCVFTLVHFYHQKGKTAYTSPRLQRDRYYLEGILREGRRAGSLMSNSKTSNGSLCCLRQKNIKNNEDWLNILGYWLFVLESRILCEFTLFSSQIL